MSFKDYLLSQIPPEVAKKWKLDECFTAPIVANDEVKNRKYPCNFRLPITYLDPSDLHQLSPIVAQDLELTVPGSENSIYSHLFKPKTQFGQNMMPAWTEYYTTNTEFLEDTQYLISKVQQIPDSWTTCIPSYNSSRNTSRTSEVYEEKCYLPDYDKFSNIRHELKEDTFFLEKYGYLEWSMLEHFNENSSFLQCLSVVNVVSPLISLFLPLIFIILPFIILKIQQIPINFTVYLEVLKTVAQNHFIGKALISMTSFSWDKVAYLGLTAGLYFLQIYQNVSICHRFYRNMIKVNEYLCELQEFVNRSIKQMEAILDITERLKSYDKFNAVVNTRLIDLKNIEFELSQVQPFEHSVKKFGETGYMLRCFYRLYSVPSYDESLRYAAGFEGYLENLRGICYNVSKGNVTMAQFTSDPSGCALNEQSYPPLLDLSSLGGDRRSTPYESVAQNTVDLNKNIILSGPNRSGKTTVLKTTTLNIIFTQQVGCGFYSSALICPYTHIHSYLNIPDTSGRDSLFQAESRRCKEILDKIVEAKKGAGSRHFCIFDELYSGTNPEEATKAGYAFLKYITGFDNVDFMLTTHYVKICKKFLKSERVENYKMYVRSLGQEGYEYTYKMKPGISKIKGATQVLKEMDYPEEIINGMK